MLILRNPAGDGNIGVGTTEHPDGVLRDTSGSGGTLLNGSMLRIRLLQDIIYNVYYLGRKTSTTLTDTEDNETNGYQFSDILKEYIDKCANFKVDNSTTAGEGKLIAPLANSMANLYEPTPESGNLQFSDRTSMTSASFEDGMVVMCNNLFAASAGYVGASLYGRPITFVNSVTTNDIVFAEFKDSKAYVYRFATATEFDTLEATVNSQSNRISTLSAQLLSYGWRIAASEGEIETLTDNTPKCTMFFKFDSDSSVAYSTANNRGEDKNIWKILPTINAAITGFGSINVQKYVSGAWVNSDINSELTSISSIGACTTTTNYNVGFVTRSSNIEFITDASTTPSATALTSDYVKVEIW